MPRPRVPHSVAVLTGRVKHDPQRFRALPPETPGELGDAPEHMAPAAAGVWAELEALAPLGVLTASDRALVEITANLIAEYRQDPREFRASRIALLVGSLGRLGMSPADRQKLGVTPTKPEENPFDAF